MRMMTALAALLLTAAPAAAQHADHAGHPAGGGLPAGWQGRVDRENQKLEDVRLMAMGSDLHAVTGPHVVLWRPDRTASGVYTASATFTQKKPAARLEGYGLMVGGRSLDGPDQDYLYFLVRQDGSFMVRHRAGNEVHTLADWTPHAAVRKPTANAEAANQLTIDSGAGRVRFLVNGAEVFALDRVPMLNTDGLVGLRIGHNVDIHIRDFTVAKPRS